MLKAWTAKTHWLGSGWLAAGVVLAAGAAAYGFLLEPRKLKVRRVTIRLHGLPPEQAGLRIGHVSDLHIGNPRGPRTWRRALREVMDLRPDLIVCTGDLVHQVPVNGAVDQAAAALGLLEAPRGVYWVPGNHDHTCGITDRLARALRRQGIPMLRNRARSLPGSGRSVWLAGVDDMVTGRPSLAAALDPVPADALVILLSHAPDVARDAAGRNGPAIALQLSGHSHGGQVRLPLIGPAYRPAGARLYPNGLCRIPGTTTQLYTSAGVGLSGPPVRFNCPPEIGLITLQPAAS